MFDIWSRLSSLCLHNFPLSRINSCWLLLVLFEGMYIRQHKRLNWLQQQHLRLNKKKFAAVFPVVAWALVKMCDSKRKLFQWQNFHVNKLTDTFTNILTLITQLPYYCLHNFYIATNYLENYITYCSATIYMVDYLTFPSTPHLQPVPNLLHHHYVPQHLQLGF